MAGSVQPSRLNLNPAFVNKQIVPYHAAPFDFGSGMPLPPVGWNGAPAGGVVEIKEEPGLGDDRDRLYLTAPYRAPAPPAGLGGSVFRSFWRCADSKLLEYLHGRNVSRFFLIEIDKFLKARPELSRYQPRWAEIINYAHPLLAYLEFVQGYTKPARYNEGVLGDLRNIHLIDDPVPTADRPDDELVDFFDGHAYRYDILRSLDHEVRGLQDALYHGMQVNHAQRQLVVLALYGNPVDAFKWFEYNYQTEWLVHRYLPEHIRLTRIPKQPGYREPYPVQVLVGGAYEERESWPATRKSMAAAWDAGVDVIDVLLTDFTLALARAGHKRDEIERMRHYAERDLNHERRINGGHDVVDMIMDRINGGARLRTSHPEPPRMSRRHAILARRIGGLKAMLRVRSARGNEHKLWKTEWQLVSAVTALANEAGTMDAKTVKEWRDLYSGKAQSDRLVSGRDINLLRELEVRGL